MIETRVNSAIRLPKGFCDDGFCDDRIISLRPALDGVLELSRRLAENDGDRLSPRQVDYAQTIYSIAAELRLAMDRPPNQAGTACGEYPC